MLQALLKLILVSAVLTSVNAVAANPPDQVSAWNEVAMETSSPGKTPGELTRAMAMTHIAIYDALNAIDRRYQPYCYPDSGDPYASPEAAIIAAAHTVLSHLNPAQTGNSKWIALHGSLASIPDGPEKSAGIQIGTGAANCILVLRTNDGSELPSTYSASTYDPGPTLDPGEYRPTPGVSQFLMPGWGVNVKPFTMTSNDRWRPTYQPYFRLTSPTYTREYNEVKTIGSATDTDLEREQIAKFWYGNPFGLWNAVARTVAVAHNLDLWESSRLHALNTTAHADAMIAIWDAKLAYPFWRPMTAINEGDNDGNPETIGDPNWKSRLTNPPYPDFSSGHAGLDAAAAEVMKGFFGTDNVSFSLTSFPPFAGITRSFASFSMAAKEGAESRIYAGIHFRSACDAGYFQGEKMAQQLFNHYFRPIGTNR